MRLRIPFPSMMVSRGGSCRLMLVVCVLLWLPQAEAQAPSPGQIQFDLAQAYESGDGVPRSMRRAVLHYRKAAELGEPAAVAKLVDVFFTGNGVDRNDHYALALALYLRAWDLAAVSAIQPTLDRLLRNAQPFEKDNARRLASELAAGTGFGQLGGEGRIQFKERREALAERSALRRWVTPPEGFVPRVDFTDPRFEGGVASAVYRQTDDSLRSELMTYTAADANWPKLYLLIDRLDPASGYAFTPDDDETLVADANRLPIEIPAALNGPAASENLLGDLQYWRFESRGKPCVLFRQYPRVGNAAPKAGPATTDRLIGAYCDAPGQPLARRSIERVFGYFRPGEAALPRLKPDQEDETAARPLHQRVLKSITGALEAVTPDIGSSGDGAATSPSSEDAAPAETQEAEAAEDFGQ